MIAAAALVVASAWATYVVTRPPDDPGGTLPYTLVEVTEGQVGASVQMNTIAKWAPTPLGANRASGVITTVDVTSGAKVAQGEKLYSVDLRPVFVAEGAVPSFRDVGSGLTGDDVKQVQQMLADLGFYDGPVVGESGAGTAAAIRAWQRSNGVEATGIVESRSLIFVPSLPARVSLDSAVVHVGATLVGGEQVLSGISDSPTFTVPVTDAQATNMPVGTRVEISGPDNADWVGYVSAQTRDDASGVVTATLTGRDGNGICGTQCERVPVTGETALNSTIVTVEATQGLVVPSAALVSGADGTIAVVDETGLRLPVKMVTSARGMSVIDGVTAGTRVRVPGDVRP